MLCTHLFGVTNNLILKAYIRTFSLEGVLFYFILIPRKVVNYLLIRGTMSLILRKSVTFLHSINFHYSVY